jgi:hypothetical protein
MRLMEVGNIIDKNSPLQPSLILQSFRPGSLERNI